MYPLRHQISLQCYSAMSGSRESQDGGLEGALWIIQSDSLAGAQ